MLFDENSIKYLHDGKTISGLESDDNYICCLTEFNCFLNYWVKQIDESLRNVNDAEIVEILNKVAVYDVIDDLMEDADFCNSCMHCNMKFVGAFLAVMLDRFVKIANTYTIEPSLSDELKEVSKTHFGYLGQCVFLMNNIWQCSGELQLLQVNVNLPTSVSANAKKAASARHATTRGYREEALVWFQVNGHRLTADQAAKEISDKWPIALRTAMDWVSGFRKELRSACK